jgi:hypothetical protein
MRRRVRLLIVPMTCSMSPGAEAQLLLPGLPQPLQQAGGSLPAPMQLLYSREPTIVGLSRCRSYRMGDSGSLAHLGHYDRHTTTGRKSAPVTHSSTMLPMARNREAIGSAHTTAQAGGGIP